MGQTEATPEVIPEDPTWNDPPFFLVSFGVAKSRRYHEKMRSFYESIVNLVLVLNALAGAGAFLALFGGKNSFIAQILIGIVAAGSATTTSLSLPRRAKQHQELGRRFTALAAQMVEGGPSVSGAKKAEAERLKIEQDELPIKRLVDLQARNEELRSRGCPETEMVPLSRTQNALGYVFTFGMRRLERWKAAQQTS